ncbi:hypothetical protein AFK20_04120 [Enhydrobacter aerosaccus]|uniref:Uncharacterized protein n=1 Tax=Enhydrobacter aerosaccus TaxID=225324 RepID=A0ABR5IMT1_9HYPH|nr:DUF11 domain-containing protein [Enhydrobacter aerosaccus]KND22313.1 hypothetical protein AFK20_04120 [Enhydrobacter aerosaccus]
MQKFLPRLNQLAASIALVAGGVALMPTAQAAAPTAGSNISNIATASYTDGNGASKTVTSNEVKTIVLQVSSFTLVADRNATINPNGTATLSHTLTNTGNGTDTFTLNVSQLSGDNFDLTNVHIYLDSNQDGVPDNNTDITTVTLTANQSVGIIVVSTVPVTQTDGQKAQYTLNVTAGFDTSVTGFNTDTVTVSAGASMQIQKSASVASVAPNGDITYTLTYKNTGNGAAPFVTIKDTLPNTVTYNAGSGLWSGSSTALTDAAGGDPAGIDYRYDSGSKTVYVSLTNVPANSTGTVKFTVKANAGNNSTVNNTASIFIDDNNDPTNTPTGTTPTQSNQTTVTPTLIYTGTINDSATDVYADADKVTTDPNKDDQILSVTSQGVPVVFGNNAGSTDGGPDLIVVHNTGTATETYNVSINKSALPSGSIVQLFKSDGVTPLTDTNGDGVVDTGPIAAGGTYNVIAKVTLPSTYSETDTNITNVTTLTLTPVSNPSATDTIKLIITDVVKATVDLTNGDNTDTTTGGPTAGSSGQDTGVPVDTKTTAPGTAVTFPLSVTNNSTTPDNFNLSSTGLPSGWTVQYYVDANQDGVPDGGAAITNTGNIPAGSTVNLIAVVTPSANQAPITQNVVFTVSSPATGLSDSMTDQVVVSAKRSLSLAADNVGQVAPGGTVTYTHTLTNNGTITEGTTAGSLPYTLTNTQLGWTTTLYVDLNNNGLADNNELVTGNDLGALIATYNADNNNISGLEAGQSIKLFIKVEAPANATAGVQNSNVLTVSPTTVSGTTTSPVSNTDLTTVNDGQIRLVKEQALDATCNGNAIGSFTQNNLSAKPGTCVVYRITATNEGNVPVTTVKINDNVPTYTTLVSGSASNNNTSGTVTVNGIAITNSVATLSGNTSAQLQFTVKIDE